MCPPDVHDLSQTLSSLEILLLSAYIEGPQVGANGGGLLTGV